MCVNGREREKEGGGGGGSGGCGEASKKEVCVNAQLFPASKRNENHLKGVPDFYLKTKARLSFMCCELSDASFFTGDGCGLYHTMY